MRKSTKVLVIIAVIVAASGYALYVDLFHIYTLRDDNGGTIIWDANEAYLFMSVARRGYRLNWPTYAAAILGQFFNAPPAPTDQRIFFIVIHVTPAGVERHVAKITENAIVPHFFTPVGQTIYAFSEGMIYKWAGDRFDKATQEEERKVGGLEHLSSDSDETINGSSKRGIGQVAGDAEFTVNIGTEATLKVRQGNVYKSAADSPTIQLYRPGKPVQELWHVNGEPRRVSRRKYDQALSTLGSN